MKLRFFYHAEGRMMTIFNEILWCQLSILIRIWEALSPIETHIFLLRTLKYFAGILFVTTNRVGTVDEALISRAHVGIFFPYFNIQKTVDLASINLKRSEMIAEQHATRTKAPKLIIKHDEIKALTKDQLPDRPS